MIDRSTSSVFYRDVNDDYPMIVRALGHRLWDDRGRELVDLTSGLSAAALIGQGRIEIGDAVRDQIAKVSYIHSSGATHPAQEELADRLVSVAPPGLSKVMFTSGGSEANELALRITRQYHLANGRPERRMVLALHPSYHGATAGALSITGRWDVSGDYDPYLFAAHHVPAPVTFRGGFRGLEPHEAAAAAAGALEAAIESVGPERVAAFIGEPIALSTGMAVPPPGYWQAVRDLCTRYGIVFIADEIITGMGRTGSFFRCGGIGVSPDIMTLAKGLSAGYSPLGATLVGQHIVDVIGATRRRMAEVHTHSGAPIPCAVGSAVFDIVMREGLVERAAVNGPVVKAMLDDLLSPLQFVGEVRGEGLMLGVEYVSDRETRHKLPRQAHVARTISEGMRQRGFMSRTMQHQSSLVGDCTSFMPALSMDLAEMEAGVTALRDVLLEVAPGWRASLS